MPISVIASTSAGSTDYHDVTTSPVNTTGATAIILLATFGVATPAVSATNISDNKGNGTPIDSGIDVADGYNSIHAHLYYYLSPTVGSGHTFIFTKSENTFPTLHVLAVSGIQLSSPLDQSSTGTGTTQVTSVQPGSVTPTEANELVLTGVVLATPNNEAASVGSGFTYNYVPYDSIHYGGGLGYKIQTTAGAENPTWSWTTAAFYYAALIASFKAAAASTPVSASDTLRPGLTEASSLVKYPAVTARTESNVTTAGTSHSVSRPAAVAGNLVLILFGYVGSVTTIGWPAGYTPLLGFKNQQTGRSWDAAYHLDTGGESTSITVTTTGTSTKSCHVAYSIGGAMDPSVQYPEIGTTATGAAGTSADPPSVSGTGGSKAYLAIAAMIQAGEEADDDTWCTAAPSGYSQLLQKTTDIAGAPTVNVSLATAERQFTGASENPGVFTTAQTLTWIAQTILIHPAVPSIPKTASDTVRPVVSEVSSVKAQISLTDTARPVLTESASSLVSRSALTDTARPVLSETASLMDRSATTETVRPVLSEVASLIVRLSVSESVRPVATEAPAVLFQAEAKLATESVRPVLIEARTLVSRTSTTDTARPIISEARSLVARSSLSDTTHPVLSEAVSLIVRLSTSDTVRPVMTEAPAGLFQAEAKLAVDTGRPVLTEARSLLSRTSTSDPVRPVLSEATGLAARSTRTESLVPILSEQASVSVPVVTIPLSASDLLRPVALDSASVVGQLSASDLLAPHLTEARLLVGRSSVSDTLLPGLTDVASLLGRSTRLDLLAPHLTEAPAGVIAILSLTASDLLTVPLVDAPAQLIVLAPPPIGLIRLGQVRLTPAGRTAQLTLKPAATGAAVEVTHAALSAPRAD